MSKEMNIEVSAAFCHTAKVYADMADQHLEVILDEIANRFPDSFSDSDCEALLAGVYEYIRPFLLIVLSDLTREVGEYALAALNEYIENSELPLAA